MNPLDLDRLNGALSSVQRELIFLTKETCPATLIDALEAHLPHVSADEWPRRIARGGVYVNGASVLHDTTLPVPCRIEYFEPKRTDDDEVLESIYHSLASHIVFEDESLLVVYKPVGLSSLPTREQKFLNLKSFLIRFLTSRDGACTLHMPSRVDTSVAGLVITSKHPRMHAPLQRLFERRAIEKIYLLETASPLTWISLVADRAIDRDYRHEVLRQTVEKGGQAALTYFRRVSESSAMDLESREHPSTILEAKPKTGRTHQIRVHAASYGFPIVGDNFYGGLPATQLHLVSYRALFTHPITREPVEIRAPDTLLPDWIVNAVGTA